MILLNAVTIVTTGVEVPVAARDYFQGRDEITVQTAITGGTATVRLYGRLSSLLPWVQLQDVSSSGLLSIARLPQLRADVITISGATVSVDAFSG